MAQIFEGLAAGSPCGWRFEVGVELGQTLLDFGGSRKGDFVVAVVKKGSVEVQRQPFLSGLERLELVAFDKEGFSAALNVVPSGIQTLADVSFGSLAGFDGKRNVVSVSFFNDFRFDSRFRDLGDTGSEVVRELGVIPRLEIAPILAEEIEG